jgi:5S rRNA maturation endonuclease (ribonuclease M5)
MNCLQAKKVPIIGFLRSQGINPVAVKNGTAIYHSPFKEDRTPSFYVDYKKEYDLQVWKDFSTGDGGNVLDLIMKMYSVDIPGALIILQKPEISKPDISIFSQQDSIAKNSQSNNIEIKKIQPLQNRVLLQYLNSRKISQSKAVNFVQEVYYLVDGKQYFSLAFRNDRGGYELRNKYFKGSSSPKAPTTIKGNNEAVNIFEGMFDFLSALEYYKVKKPVSISIVLNSISSLDKIIGALQNYKQVNLFLDNDTAGELAAEKIKSTHRKVKNYSKIIFPNFNDMNDYLTSINKKQHN